MSQDTINYSTIVAEEENLVYVIDKSGNIEPMRYTLYVALPANDPRLFNTKVSFSRRHAETIQRKIRKLPTGFEVEKVWN